VFVCGNGDISFCDEAFTDRIIATIKGHNVRCPYKSYYFQSKRPEYFEKFLAEFPDNVLLVTTLETNRDKDYEAVSQAPVPSVRYHQFRALDYPRKVVTIEPVMDFDPDAFLQWIINLKPESVYLGYNSHAQRVGPPEPSEEKLCEFIRALQHSGVRIETKDLRGACIASL
jgi:hypothetical protein